MILNPFNIKSTYDKKKSRSWLNSLYNISDNCILFGYIGRLVNWKNVDFLINCFAEYTKNNSHKLHLIVVGSGGKEYEYMLKNLVYKLGMNNLVTFTGFNSHPNRVISAFDLIIAPSNKEPFGRTLVEAMIQKTPVVAAKGGGHSEIVDDGVTGRLYDHDNINSFISQCNAFINDNKSTCRMTNKANAVAKNKYSSSQHVDSVKQVYSQLFTI